MTERVLITGASGFLGYHLVLSALESKLEVWAAVRKNSQIDHLKNLPIQYVYLNFESPEQMKAELVQHQITYVIHAAGITKAVKQEEYNHVNATYSINLAEAIKGTSVKKLVFISSLAAAGPSNNPTASIHESDDAAPVTAYGRSKLLAEQQLKATGIPLVVLRPTAIYGPRDKDIFIMLKTVHNGLDPYIGKIQQQLSFVHARDVADVAVNALLNNQAAGTYHISDGQSYSRYRLSDITKNLLSKKALRFHIPIPLVKVLAYVLETTYGWANKPAVINREKLHELAALNWNCSIQKAVNELAYKPNFNLESGLKDTLNWYKNNQWL